MNQLDRRCLRCGDRFTLTGIEVRYFAEQKQIPPVHCRECRATANAGNVPPQQAAILSGKRVANS